MPLGGIQTFPTAEPTSALAFSDLITEVAYKIGCAYYGSTGTGAPQVPVDAHDLALCQNIVNKAIRMFINDGYGIGGKRRASGWNWIRPIAQVDLWPMIAADGTGSTNYVTSTGYNSTLNLTTLNLTLGGSASSTNTSTALWYPSMELQNIFLGGNPPSGTIGWQLPVNGLASTSTIGTAYTIVNYLSANQIQIHGQPPSSTFASTGTASTSWSMVANGDYTLPADFAGQPAGEITYVQNTNRGMTLQWTSEASIRTRRQNFNFESGTPYECAVRLMPTPSITNTQPGANSLTYAPQRRRWQLMTWRISSEFLHVLFPYVLGFQNLINLTDSPPSPFAYDEALKAACLAQAEFDVENQYGVAWQYYKQNALQQAYVIDEMSAPKRMGYFGNPSAAAGAGAAIRNFRDSWYQRPTVGVNPLG